MNNKTGWLKDPSWWMVIITIFSLFITCFVFIYELRNTVNLNSKDCYFNKELINEVKKDFNRYESDHNQLKKDWSTIIAQIYNVKITLQQNAIKLQQIYEKNKEKNDANK